MRLVFQKTKSKLATIMICFDAGARAEGKEYNPGIAHMLEHMIFKGTEKRGYLDIPMEIARIGGSTNAYTSMEQVVYYITAPVESLETTMDILSDMVFHSTFPEEEFLKEREVVTEECAASEDQIDNFVHSKFFENYLTGRPAIPVIGTLESIKEFSRDELVRFYKQFYTLENCIVAITANKKKSEIEDLVSKYISKPDGKFKGLSVRKSKVKRKSQVTVSKENLQQSYVYMAFDVGELDKSKEAVYDILFEIFGSGMDSRLFTEVREKRGLCYSISAGTFRQRDANAVIISSDTRPEKINQMVEVINTEVEKMKTELVTEEELVRAKNKWKSYNYAKMESSQSMLRDSMQRTFFKFKSLKSIQETIDSVSAEDVLQAANEIFDFNKSQLFVCKSE